MKKKIDIGPDGKVWVTWKVNPLDHSPEKEKEIAQLVAKKYEIPIANVKVEPILNTTGKDGEQNALNSSMAENLQDPVFQHELFKEWLKINHIEDIDFDEILKIDSQVNALMDYSVYEKSKRYRINWVKWDNFLSYGDDNHFDFNDLHGLVLLNGEPANESGKSTFAYDLLHFLLFGKVNPERAKTNDQLFNNYRKDKNEVNVEGCITIDGNDYIIKRTLTRKSAGKSASQKVRYFQVIGDVTEELVEVENVTGENTAKTNKAIKEALGNEKNFDLIISANAKDLDELISMGESDRGKLLSKWIGLSPLQDKEVIAKDIRKSELAKGQYSSIYNKVEMNDNIASASTTIGQCSAEIETLTKNLNAAIQEKENLDKEKDNLVVSKQPIDNDLVNVDMETLKHTIDDVCEQGKLKASQVNTVSDEIKEMGEIALFNLDEYKAIVLEKEAKITRIAEIKTEINALKTTCTTLEKQEYCPTCGRKFENVDNSQLIAEHQKTIQSLIQEGINVDSERKSIDAKISDLENLRTINDRKAKLELRKMALETEVKELRLEYVEKNKLLQRLELNKEAIRINNEIDVKINLLNANIKTQENTITSMRNNISMYESNISQLNNKILEYKAIIAKIEEEEIAAKNWNVYLKMLSKDGICKMVLRHSLPIINLELKNLLSDCADFNVEIDMNESNAVEFWLIRDDIKTRLSAASGLERTQSALALRVVLGKMSRLSCPPFILLDEILGTVSATNYDKMKMLYDKIVPLYDFVLHITHLNLEEWHDMTLTVEKIDNISHVKPLIKK